MNSDRIEISGEKGHRLILRSPPQKKDGTPLLSRCCRDDKKDERNLLIECHSVPEHILLHLACELRVRQLIHNLLDEADYYY